MPSPFPGMNPYLESPDVWPPFHGDLIRAFRDQLLPQVRPRYRVVAEKSMVIDSPDGLRTASPDDSIIFQSARHPLPSSGEGAPELRSPVTVEVEPPLPVERQYRVTITDRRGSRVVSVIELVSRANKLPGEGRRAYLRKRSLYRHANVNVVEVDLLRDGPRLLNGLPSCDGYAAVLRGPHPQANVWPFGLRDTLPAIPVPLDEGDPHAQLDLKAALEAAYEAGAYGDYAYDAPPEPPLPPADAAWAGELAARARTA